MALTIQRDNTVAVGEDRDVYISATREVEVTGVTRSAHTTLQTILEDASIPQPGDAHPAISNLYVKNREAKPMTADAWLVTVHYGPLAKIDDVSPPPKSVTLKSITASTESEEVNTDKDGNLITVTYEDGNGIEHTRPVSLQDEIATLTIRFRRRETSDPTATFKSYINTLNSDTVTWLSGAAVGEIWCCNLSADELDTGDWDCTYEFKYKAGGFDKTAVYTDDKGLVPEDVDDTAGSENGVTTPTLKASAAFSSLSL